MLLRLDGEGSLYSQVYRGLRSEILAGALGAGNRLPSSRSLAYDLGVSRNVVTLAYEQLLLEGYTEARVGAGTYVTSPLPECMLRAPTHAAPSPEPRPRVKLSAYGKRALEQLPENIPEKSSGGRSRLLFDFRYGVGAPDETTLQTWRRLLAQRSQDLALDYDAPEGIQSLREIISQYLRKTRGLRCDADQVLVVNGSQQALDLTARVLLEPGAAVVMEEAHYHGARRAFLAAAAKVVPAPLDSDGLVVSRIPKRAAAARLAYVTPSHQFPTGAVMPLARRLELLQWAEDRDAYILEDDYDSEFRYEGRPIEAVQAHDHAGRVLYVGTFSKILFPSLRLGFMVLPRPLMQAFTSVKWLTDRHTPVLEQAVLADFFAGCHFDRHVRRMRKQCAARREALLDALHRHLNGRVDVCETAAGVHLLAWLRDFPRQRLPELIQRAAARGVGIYSHDWCYTKAPEHPGLLMGYAALKERQIEEGIRRLAEVLNAVAAPTARTH